MENSDDEEIYQETLESIAQRFARMEQISLGLARQHVRHELDLARQRYRDAGAPYDDTVAGFTT
jgi:hypothetical protein